ncbi:MAG TPA: hypothetical protein VIL65_18230 [Beijerinckiaceae bacterium]|jgi:hypothetical protein
MFRSPIRHRLAAFVAAALGLAAAAPAVAFEAFGFAPRMDVPAFLAQARDQGYQVRAHNALMEAIDEKDWSVPGAKSFELRRPGARGGTLVVAFCQERLHMLSQAVDGGYHEFTRAVAEAQAIRGRGKVEVRSHVARGALVSTMQVEWPDPASRMAHGLRSFGFESTFLITRYWQAEIPGCPGIGSHLSDERPPRAPGDARHG